MKNILKIIASDRLLKIVTFGNPSVAGISLWPFVIVKKKYSSHRVLINHERVHIVQQAEMAIIPFYLWYIVEYIIRLIQYRNTNKAYKNISFEREAYSNDKNLNYLKTRKPFSFLKYLSK